MTLRQMFNMDGVKQAHRFVVVDARDGYLYFKARKAEAVKVVNRLGGRIYQRPKGV